MAASRMKEALEERDCAFDGHRLMYHREELTVWLEPWGRDGIRVRQSVTAHIPDRTYGLLPQRSRQARVFVHKGTCGLVNGCVRASLDARGNVVFHRLDGNRKVLLLAEAGRYFETAAGEVARITLDFVAQEGERFYGLGQHDNGRLDQKGCVIDLRQVNTQVAIPFMVSSRGYGFIWHDPAVGRVELAHNRTRWVAECSRGIDYVVCTGDGYGEILARYADLTGHPPRLPAWAAGFWQSKLRYRTQEELLDVAREYRRRGLPLSVIVLDFFHWTMLGDFRFDPVAFPDPAAMVRELKAMGVELAVSVWPMVNHNSSNYAAMKRAGLLLRPERGAHAQHEFIDTQSPGRAFSQYYDASNPQTMRFVWQQIKRTYHDLGIRVFWLDNCEPDIEPKDFDNLRLYLGNGNEVACVYPLLNQRGFHQGLLEAGERDVVTLCRSGWLGSQRYGTIIWSGDIGSDFATLARQVKAGLNMAMSGIPWWNTDIGGFHGGDPREQGFAELVVRWFQYGVFCPITRLHGCRNPADWSSVRELTGAPNEVWSFGERAYGILSEWLFLRQRLRPYILRQMDIAHQRGLPPMRPLFVDFPDDAGSRDCEDEYLFGPDLLVAPITAAGVTRREVWLPAGVTWRDAWTGRAHRGGRRILADAPLEHIPVFYRDGAAVGGAFAGMRARAKGHVSARRRRGHIEPVARQSR